MAHLKPETDVIGRVARVAGLVMLIGFLFPTVRRTLSGLGIVAGIICLLAVISLLGFGFYRLAKRSGKMPATDDNPFAPSTDEAEPIWPQDETEATLELVGPALRRRYPWRH
jgi:hypothetical protein